MNEYIYLRSCHETSYNTYFLTNSENTRNDLLNAYPTVDERRTVVTPLAADTSIFFPPEDVAAELADSVVFVGQRAGYKRFDLAVEAVARSHYTFVVVGSPLTKDEILLLQDKLSNRWRFLGRLSDAELRSVYGGAYAFIYPSDYEGFGLPILEAQACGCPVVAANRSSFPEVGGVSTLYAKEQTADAYLECLTRMERSDLRLDLKNQGYANVKRFSWDKTFQLTLDAIKVMAS